jgi:hypothetical protein
MADVNPTGKSPPAATVEDCAESDDEKGDSSASKPASNSASKRSRKTSKTRPASDVRRPEAPTPPEVKDAPTQPPEEYVTRAGLKHEVNSEPGAKKSHRSRRPSQAPPPSSPRNTPKEQRPRIPERRPHAIHPPQGPPCYCGECMTAPRYGSRPGPNPVQQDHRAYTTPAGPSHGQPPVIRHGPSPGMMPPGHIPPPEMRPMYPPNGFPPGVRPPPQMIPVVDPRLQPIHSAMPHHPHPGFYASSGVSMPPSLPGLAGPSLPIRGPTRPAIHQPERSKTSSSVPKLSSKISTYDTVDTSSSPFSPDDDEHISARTLPTKPHHVPGGFESDPYSSESPPDSPPYLEQPRRPQTFHRATTSAVQQIHRSGHTRSRSNYPAESAYGYRHVYPSEPAYDQYSRTQYPGYEDRRSYPGGRRGSNATTWTQQTSASDPPHPSYVHYDHHGHHGGHEYAANDYMDRARGHAEERITAESLRQLHSGPHSTRSNHSHRRSQHSMSETSSRHRAAEGSVKFIMPIAAAGDTKIQLSGDMGDHELSFRAANDPGMVEVTIGTVAGSERRYLKSASQSSRAPTRSSGSTRHATRGGAEGQEQGREYREHREHREHRHSSRAPSSRKS